MGPRESLPDVLSVLQDFGQLHLTPPKESEDVGLLRQDPAEARREVQLERILRETRGALDALGVPPSAQGAPPSCHDREVLAGWARLARRVRGEARALRDTRDSLEEERLLLSRYRQFFPSFESLSEAARGWPDAAAFHVILPGGRDRSLQLLERGLRDLLGEEFWIRTQELDSGELGALILVARDAAARLEELFRSTRVQEVELPGTEKGLSTAEAIPRVLARLEAIPDALRRIEQSMGRLRSRHAETLAGAEAALSDALERIDVAAHSGATDLAFVLEGWLPANQRSALARRLADDLGDTLVVEELSREEWVGEEAPVVLRNPRLFRPFESLVAMLPMPRYGSIDPTPFVAIFFPMFFGLVLGDVGYGVLLGMAALMLSRRAPPESPRRVIAEIAGACAVFTVVFGFLYGELFGDAGATLFGMRALALHREEALVPFLGLALAIGVVHMLLGLVLNLVAKIRQGVRAAVGPSVTLAMVSLIVLAILAAVGVLPGTFFTPAVVLVLVLFPVLVAVEGILGATELLSTLGRILSYARVMAVGTASVMMAIAANRMVGAMGSVLVGSLFALLFHLVNFILGVFSPAVHALRLHFVEFFGTFYSPGGTRYQPFQHWAPDPRSPTREGQ